LAAALPFRYSVYGVTLDSDVSFALPAARDGATGDRIRIARGRGREFDTRLAGLALDVDAPVHQLLLEDGGLYMRWSGVFDLLVAPDGGRISCRSFGAHALDYVEAYLLNYAVSAALLLRGEETLHATAVDIGGRVVGLLGASGSGKSTLASFLRTKGARIVTDDVLRIGGADAPRAYPGPHRLKLFDESATRFLAGASPSGRWSPMRDKFVYDLGLAKPALDPQPLVALYHLRAPQSGGDGRIALTRLRGLELFRTIGGSTMNNALRTPGRLERHFRFVERLARRLPVHALAYPRDFVSLEEVAAAIFRTADAGGAGS
jgi:hypothetical protein